MQHQPLRGLDSLAVARLCMASPLLHKQSTTSLPLMAALCFREGMRTNHKEMIEILNTFEKDEGFFAQIAKYFGESRQVYQFGVSKAGYNTIKRIFQSRPFENLSQSNYRYFWSYGCGTDEEFYLSIQYEQDRNVKTLQIKADKDLGSNLRWFIDIKKPNEIEHLEIKT